MTGGRSVFEPLIPLRDALAGMIWIAGVFWAYGFVAGGALFVERWEVGPHIGSDSWL